MFALFFFVLNGDPSGVPNVSSNDWNVANAPQANVQIEKKPEFNPAEPLYTQGTMCVVVKGQPEPECAKANSATPIKLSEDIFGHSAGAADTTCQTIETIKRDVNGNPKRVYATYCGEDPSRADYRTRETPTSGATATRPTQRKIGPNEVGSVATE